MPWPADPSRPADTFRWGERLDEAKLDVYALDTVDADIDCGDEFRCVLATACDMALGAYVDVEVIGSEPMPAVDE